MPNNAIRRHAPFWISIAIGIAIWEIAGRNTSQAFMVPFSTTMLQLWKLILTGEFLRQFLSSAELFLTGFVLALVVGMPRKKIEAVATLMKKIGGITADKEPVSFDQFVDATVWKDANAQVK